MQFFSSLRLPSTALLLMLIASSDAFSSSSIPSTLGTTTSMPSSSNIATTTTRTATRQRMTLGDVSEFYATYPLQSAVLTCGLKASIADGIAQVKAALSSAAAPEEMSLEVKRNVAYILYGGIFIGLMCHMEYDYVFPALFGTDHSVLTILQEILFDNFISGPLLWLPPAYLIKAILYDYPIQEGLQNYWSDIHDHGLLRKYWTVWLPAQTVSFSLVPDHLRVAFMASVSFFWFIMFSTVAAENDVETLEDAALVAPRD